MPDANLTRFGPESFRLVRGEPRTRKADFVAMENPGELVVRNDGVERAWILLNGARVVGPDQLAGGGDLSIDVDLKRNNCIEITVPGLPEGELAVRVRQKVQADLGLLFQGYFGLNTSDMERQRRLYEAMGFPGEIYPAGPETSESFAQALGFPEDYLIHVSLHSLQDPPTPPFVDTVQFRGDSYREEPPYARLNHLGMAYATYTTTDLDGAWAHLQSHGVKFVSAPAVAPNGERFVFMKDQDGAFLKLVQAPMGAQSNGGSANLVRLENTNMNVSDLERSREFYRMIGFAESVPASQAGDGEFSAAHGFEGPIEFEGQDIRLADDAGGATLQLRRWITPFDAEPPYAPPVNHLGIDRINFYVKDLTETIRVMNDLGFEQMGPIGGFPEVGIVFFRDPDGIKVQFAGPQT